MRWKPKQRHSPAAPIPSATSPSAWRLGIWISASPRCPGAPATRTSPAGTRPSTLGRPSRRICRSMTAKARRRGLKLPILFVTLGVLILLGLGTWQVYRLHWKEGILAEITAAEQHPPAPLADHPPEYGRVSVTGRFRFDKALSLGVD